MDWKAHLFHSFFSFDAGTGVLPFSLVYEGETLETLRASGHVVFTALPDCDENQSGAALTFPCGLQLEIRTRRYPIHGGLEMRFALRHTGNAPSGLVEALHSGDFLFAPNATAGSAPPSDEGHFFDYKALPVFELLTMGGAYSDPDDFTLRTTRLDRDTAYALSAGGGRSSSANMPYFRVTQGKHALIAAIGWAGQWRAAFEASTRKRLRIQLGIEQLRIRLRPEESFVLPSVLLCYDDSGQPYRVHHQFRSMLYEQLLPLTGAQEQAPYLFSNTCFVKKGEWLNETDENNQRSLIDALAAYDVDAVITDAGWFEGGWPHGAGNWMQPKAAAYPCGFAPLSEAARKSGTRYGLWFEPERVMAGTRLAGEIPELCLRLAPHRRDTPEALLADFGCAKTRAFFLDIIGHYVESQGIEAYRQDMNVEPLFFWRDNDEPLREGIHELAYITGLYTFWDELHARYPQLFLDGCASGGRRLDYETLRRFHTHQKSDYWFDPVTDQNALFALHLYLPAPSITAHVDSLRRFDFLSAATATLCLGWAADHDDFDHDTAQSLVEQYRMLRQGLSGVYYPLPDLDAQSGTVLGMEFYCPEQKRGFALLFRRQIDNAPAPAADIALHGIRALQNKGNESVIIAFDSGDEAWREPASSDGSIPASLVTACLLCTYGSAATESSIGFFTSQ